VESRGTRAESAQDSIARNPGPKCGACGEALAGPLSAWEIEVSFKNELEGERDGNVFLVACPGCGAVLGVLPFT